MLCAVLPFIKHAPLFRFFLLNLLPMTLLGAIVGNQQDPNEKQSILSRKMSSYGTHITNPSNPIISRKHFPESGNPKVCLAFLSCCGRTDLLNHTLSGAIRHMEEDEPDGFRYEIAHV